MFRRRLQPVRAARRLPCSSWFSRFITAEARARFAAAAIFAVCLLSFIFRSFRLLILPLFPDRFQNVHHRTFYSFHFLMSSPASSIGHVHCPGRMLQAFSTAAPGLCFSAVALLSTRLPPACREDDGVVNDAATIYYMIRFEQQALFS